MVYLGLLAGLASVVIFLVWKKKKSAERVRGEVDPDAFKWWSVGLALFAGIILMWSMVYVVSPGEVGVEVLFGSVQKYSSAGMNVKNPFASVIIFDVKTQRMNEKSEAASQDLQVVNVQSVVNYHLDAKKLPELYSNLGEDFLVKVMQPAIHECIKASTAKFKVEDIIVKRAELKKMVTDGLREKLAVYWIIIEDVNIKDISFSPEFNKVVEEKQIEEQKVKTAEYRRQQAEKDKESTILAAQAEGEKQRLLRNNTSPEVVSLKWIEKWDGKLPVTSLGGATPMVNIK